MLYYCHEMKQKMENLMIKPETSVDQHNDELRATLTDKCVFVES